VGSWGYVAVGFGLSLGAVVAYAVTLERRIALLRAKLRAGGRR
jgi:hypothetical protein